MKRIMLFLVTNLAVMLVLGVVLNILFSVLGINKSSISGLLMFCAVFGFGGSFISLLMSKWMAKRSYGVQVIEQPRNETEHWLVSTVARQAREAGIKMPEVGIYDSPEMNAFATGARRDDSLVAVSSGLLYSMSRDEAEAVLAHEVSHVANGDMVTLTPDPGGGKHLRDVLRPYRGRCHQQLLQLQQRRREQQLRRLCLHDHSVRAGDGIRCAGLHHRHVVQPSARVPCRRRCRQAGGS